MNALLIVAGLFVLYELLTRGNIFGSGSPGTTAGTTSAMPSEFIQQGQAVSVPGFTLHPATATGPGLGAGLIGSTVPFAASTGTSLAVGAGLFAAGSAAATAIPIVGAAFAVIFGALMAASARRAAEARSENDAVAHEVPAWDDAVDQIVNAYNAGTITADEAYQLLACPQTRQQRINNYPNGAVWQAYWNVVCPHVQPGRNACNCGSAPHQPPLTHCGGSYGAGCCVAYDDLDNGQLFVVMAIQQAERNPGMPATSRILPTVYASKYGGIDRPGYSVTVRKNLTVTV